MILYPPMNTGKAETSNFKPQTPMKLQLSPQMRQSGGDFRNLEFDVFFKFEVWSLKFGGVFGVSARG